MIGDEGRGEGGGRGRRGEGGGRGGGREEGRGGRDGAQISDILGWGGGGTEASGGVG